MAPISSNSKTDPSPRTTTTSAPAPSPPSTSQAHQQRANGHPSASSSSSTQPTTPPTAQPTATAKATDGSAGEVTPANVNSHIAQALQEIQKGEQTAQYLEDKIDLINDKIRQFYEAFGMEYEPDEELVGSEDSDGQGQVGGNEDGDGEWEGSKGKDGGDGERKEKDVVKEVVDGVDGLVVGGGKEKLDDVVGGGKGATS